MNCQEPNVVIPSKMMDKLCTFDSTFKNLKKITDWIADNPQNTPEMVKAFCSLDRGGFESFLLSMDHWTGKNKSVNILQVVNGAVKRQKECIQRMKFKEKLLDKPLKFKTSNGMPCTLEIKHGWSTAEYWAK